MNFTQVETAIPRWALDADPGVQVQQRGTATFRVYADGEQFGGDCGTRHLADELAENAWLRRYAAKVAAELGALRNETWTVEDPGEAWQRTVVITSGIARLKLSYNHEAAGKLTVSGVFPEGYGHKTFAANIDPARGARAIAREANRRVIAAGYIDELLVVRERKRLGDERQAKRDAFMARAAALFALPAPGAREKLYLGDWLAGSGYVEPYGGTDDSSLTFQLSGIDAETALRMLKVLADAPGSSAKCCYRFGPRHHPALSVLGCVRVGEVAVPGDPGERNALHDRYYADTDPDLAGLSFETWALSFGPEPVRR